MHRHSGDRLAIPNHGLLPMVVMVIGSACSSHSARDNEPTHAVPATSVSPPSSHIVSNADPRLACQVDADCDIFQEGCECPWKKVFSLNKAFESYGQVLTFSLNLGVSCAEGGCPISIAPTRAAFCKAGTCASRETRDGSTIEIVNTSDQLKLEPEREIYFGLMAHVCNRLAGCGASVTCPEAIPAAYSCPATAACYGTVDKLLCSQLQNIEPLGIMKVARAPDCIDAIRRCRPKTP